MHEGMEKDAAQKGIPLRTLAEEKGRAARQGRRAVNAVNPKGDEGVTPGVLACVYRAFVYSSNQAVTQRGDCAPQCR